MSQTNGNGVHEVGRPQFSSVIPIISVANVPKSLEYYRTVLGFEQEWGWSDSEQAFGAEEPDFASVSRGNVCFFLDHGEQGSPGSWFSLFLHSLEELDALHHEYLQSGARIVEPPADMPWGMREMRVEDLDGNVFRMGAGLEE